jgi:hypothetical protein
MAQLRLTEQAAAAAGQASRAAADMHDPGQKTKTLARVAIALAGAGLAGQAQQTAAGIEDPDQKADTLSQVAERLMTAGLAEQAAAAAGQASRAAADMHDPGQKAETLSRCAVTMARVGLQAQAVEAARQALQCATAREGPQSTAWALVKVAPALAEAGEHEQAIQIAAGIEYSQQKNDALRYVAEVLIRNGFFTQALKAAMCFDDIEERGLLLRNLLTNPKMKSNENVEIHQRALELLLFTPSVLYSLGVLPVPLLGRLVAQEYL